MILPEVYLEDGDADARIEKIHALSLIHIWRTAPAACTPGALALA